GSPRPFRCITSWGGLRPRPSLGSSCSRFSASCCIAPACVGSKQHNDTIMTSLTTAFLKKLLDTAGPSGFEQAPGRVWREEVGKFADDVRVDVHGNSVASLNGKGKPRVMLTGHIDEIGIQITHVDEDGFLYFSGIGGWDSQVLVGQRVLILSREGAVHGVVG